MAIIQENTREGVISRIRETNAEYHRNGICYTTGKPFEKVPDSFNENFFDSETPYFGLMACSVCGHRLEKET